ncbi:MAG: TrmH family RNA methyltransferase [Candidatus Beckwithbacteria bacterium]
MYLGLENIRSLYNVGSIFRTASFFGIKKVLLVGYSGRARPGVNQLHEKVKKTALGAEKDFEIKFVKNSEELVKLTRKKGLKLIAIEQDKRSVKIDKWQAEKDSVLVFGNEVEGVSQEVLAAAEEIVEIPRQGKKGSLNVEVAAAIVISQVEADLRANSGLNIRSVNNGYRWRFWKNLNSGWLS